MFWLSDIGDFFRDIHSRFAETTKSIHGRGLLGALSGSGAGMESDDSFGDAPTIPDMASLERMILAMEGKALPDESPLADGSTSPFDWDDWGDEPADIADANGR